jgi:acetolactate synthase-1/2/3 large subunit
MATVAQVFARTLKAEGIGHIFGFPGGATVEMAEQGQREGVEFVLAHSEWSAGYMAAMYGDLTGRPGVLLTTLGPGATNAVNATANAFLDRSPMLAITGRQGRHAGMNSHQRLNQVSVYEPITKWSTTVEAASFPQQLHRAIRLAIAERPGPVHLDLPGDEPAAECPDVRLPPATAAQVHYGVSAGVEPAIAHLRRAQRPLMLVGRTALRQRACAAVRRVAENWGIPVVTTAKAKGAIPESHPYAAGVVEMAGVHHMNDFVARADLLLAVGFDAVEIVAHWKHHTPTIHFDVLPNTDEVYVSELDVIGDIAGALDALAGVPREGPLWLESEIAAHRREFRRRNTLDGDTLAPSEVVYAAREILDRQALVVSDVGSHKMLLGGFWPVEEPDTYFVSNGLGTMGFSVPAALAAKIVHPDRAVVSFVGDGGFAMISGELGTAVDRGLAVVIIVFNDGTLDRILRKQAAEGYPPIGTTFGNPDFARLAEAHGACGFRATTVKEFEHAFACALASGGPAVIDVRIDPSEYHLQFHG